MTTGTARGVQLTGEHLSTWKEKAVPFRGRGTDTQNHNAAYVGWNNELAEEAKPTDTPAVKPAGKSAPKPPPAPPSPKKIGPPATFAVSVPEALRAEWGIGSASELSISLAATNDIPGPRTEPKKDDAEKPKETGPKTKAPKPPKKPKEKKKEPDKTPVELTIELVDADGHAARQPLTRYGIARHPLDSNIYRRRGRDKQRFTNIFELIPQTFLMPLRDFVQATPDFDPGRLMTVRLIFDKTVAGTIIIEHIGVSLSPAAIR